MQPKWDPGPTGRKKGVQDTKKHENIVFLNSFGRSFLETCGYLLGCHFFKVFCGEASLSLPGRFGGAKGAQKAPKMQNGANMELKRYLVALFGSARTMVFIVQEACERLW